MTTLDIKTNLKNKKVKVSLESVMKEIEEMNRILDEEIEKRKKTLNKNKGLNTFRNIKNKLKHLEKTIPKISKKTRITTNNKNNFDKKVLVSEDLATFMQIDKLIPITRQEISCALFTYIHLSPDETREKMLKWKYLNESTRNLQDPAKRDLIIPDEQLSQLLKYDEYKKNCDNKLIKNKKGEVVTDCSLRYTTILKLIQPHIIKI